MAANCSLLMSVFMQAPWQGKAAVIIGLHNGPGGFSYTWSASSTQQVFGTVDYCAAKSFYSGDSHISTTILPTCCFSMNIS